MRLGYLPGKVDNFAGQNTHDCFDAIFTSDTGYVDRDSCHDIIAKC